MNMLTDKVWHQLPAEEVAEFIAVNLSTGLSAEEVHRRQKEFGPNRVSARRGTPAWLNFLQQFNQPLVYILMLAVGATAFLSEFVDSPVIFGVVLIAVKMITGDHLGTACSGCGADVA
jgi:Ca2+-transporting ATPase